MCLTCLHVPLQPGAQASFPVAPHPPPHPPGQAGSWLTHSGDGLAIGYETKAVLEDTTAMEEWEGDAHDLLQPVLDPAQPGARAVLDLVKEFILPEREDRHQRCPGERQERICVEGLRGGPS